MSTDTTPPAEAPSPEEQLAEIVGTAVRAELDQVVPHVVAALKRDAAVKDLAERLNAAEQRLGERDRRPLVSGLRRVLSLVRRMDFEAAARETLLSELEQLLVGAGYAEFGEVGEPFDAVRHEALDGSASAATAVVAEVLEPGLETLGEVVVRARVRVADGSTPEEITP
ncbi:MAG: hypothetical protein JHC95_09890 [Solirubrobacteraceae bacterium]|nr:hypothetical protein [Solirubrobacteraceae bacterium]